MVDKTTIVLVGFRSAALQAALRLKLQVIVWQPGALPKRYLNKIALFISTPYPDTIDTFPTSILTLCKNFNIAAVIASTEKSVVPAALLQSQLNISGNSISTAVACRDKLQMKIAIAQAKFPLAAYKLIVPTTTADELIAELQLPIVIKERASSGSRGLYIAYNKDELVSHMSVGCLAESFINGKELSIESFIHNGKILFVNFTQYYLDRAINIMPAEFDADTQAKLILFNQQVINDMNIKQGMTHLELFISESGLVFGEIALRPPGGYLMDLLQISYGFDAWQAFINLNINRTISYPSLIKQYSAVWVIHPGAGTVKTITGLDSIKKLASVKSVNVRIKNGDIICKRAGAGQDCGYILFNATTRTELIRDIEQARALLQVVFS